MSRSSIKRCAGAGLAALLVLVVASSVGAAAKRPGAAKSAPRSDVLLEWYDATAAALLAANVGTSGSTQVTASRDWAVAWLAAWRALRDLGVGAKGREAPADAADAAVATAVHDVLASDLPAQKAQLDVFLANTLGRLREDVAEARGTRYGALEAALGGAVQYGQRLGEPFFLGRAGRFRPAEPPGLADLAEVRAVGAAGSAVRTPEQLAVARFWAQTSIQGYTAILRAALQSAAKRPLIERVRIVSLFHAIMTDAQLASTRRSTPTRGGGRSPPFGPAPSIRTRPGRPSSRRPPTRSTRAATPATPGPRRSHWAR